MVCRLDLFTRHLWPWAVTRALLLCSVCALNNRKVKGRKFSNRCKQCQIHNCTQEQSCALGGREGCRDSSLPPAHQVGWRKVQSVTSASCGGGWLATAQARTLTVALSHHHPPNRSSSLIVHHQPSLHVPPPQNALNSSLKAQSSEWPLPLQVILESGWPALASSPREKHVVFQPYHRVEPSLMSCSWTLGYRVRNEGNTALHFLSQDKTYTSGMA